MRPRSRWLVVGREGSGKSFTPWYIAEQFPANKVYVLDTEDKYPGIEYAGKKRPDNLLYQVATDWERVAATYLMWSKQFKPGDWFIIDSVGLLMDGIESAFRRNAHTYNQNEPATQTVGFQMAIKLEVQDYGETKPRFNSIINHSLFNVLGLNVILIAQAKPYIRVTDKKTGAAVPYGKRPEDIMQALDRFDVNPDAENAIKYNVETILQTTTSGKLYQFRVLKHPLYEVTGELVDFTKKGLWLAFNEHLKLNSKEVPGV